MPIEILMPALSPTMTEGKLAKWLVKEGDQVNSGDIIAEIETDKATMELEAVDEGVIGEILILEGTESVEVNKPIGVLFEEGEDKPKAKNKSKEQKKTWASKKSKINSSAKDKKLNEKKIKKEKNIPSPQLDLSSPLPQSKRIFISPLARRIAEASNIDISSIIGTGPGGRIVKNDVEGFLNSGSKSTIPKSSSSIESHAKERSFEVIKNSSIRKIIAKRLTEAKIEIPHFYLTIECNIDKLLNIRKELNDNPSSDFKLSVNDFIIKASALALKKVPSVNASWAGEAIHKNNQVDISIAVATDNGLITPIIKDADQKGLSEISQEMKVLAERARDNKLKPEEFQGGGFSISNLGMYGIKEFTAIINPPQSSILAVGAGIKKPAVINGELGIATIMNCTLSCDHRVIDGAVGAEFLSNFKPLIEEPLTLLL